MTGELTRAALCCVDMRVKVAALWDGVSRVYENMLELYACDSLIFDVLWHGALHMGS